MPAGRKTKYTPETVAKITQAIRMGANFTLACDYGGISLDTFERWRCQYADFAESIKESKGAAAVGWLAKIEQAANQGTWQAAAWKLERLYPQIYGKSVTEIQGTDGSPIRTETIGDNERDGLARKLDELATRRRTRQLATEPQSGTAAASGALVAVLGSP